MYVPLALWLKRPNAGVKGGQTAQRVGVPLNNMLGKGLFGRQEKPRNSAVC